LAGLVGRQEPRAQLHQVHAEGVFQLWMKSFVDGREVRLVSDQLLDNA
jgi:hypothetical protein